MRFFISAEWTQNSLLKAIVWCLLVYTLVLCATNAGLYFSRMDLTTASVIRYYRGDEERFLQPRSLLGLLEALHFHAFAMGILLMTLTHLLLFVPVPTKVKVWGIVTAFGSGLAGELAGWGVRFVHPAFAYAKIGFFLLLEGSLLFLVAVVAWALLTAAPSAYGPNSGRPTAP